MRIVLPVGWIDRSRNGFFTTGHLKMGRAASMPKLREHMAALRTDSGSDLLPAFDLLVRIHTGRSQPTAPGDRNVRCFSDDETAFGSSLRVVLTHQIVGNISWLLRSRPRKWRHHNTMAKRDRSNLNGGEQLSMIVSIHGQFRWLAFCK